MASPHEQAKDYILSKINIDENDCWIPNLKRRKNGYVRASFKGQSWYLHRLSFNAFNGEIEPNNDVCHKCDNRPCCNPEHLFQGSRKVNMQDAVRKGRQARGFALPQTKLSENDLVCIKHLINRGCEYTDIAKLFEVTRHSIGRVGKSIGIQKRKAS